jgi:hypothetical protein
MFHQGSGRLPSPTFQDGKLPAYVTVKACLIDWPMFLGAVPVTPISKHKRQGLGDTFELYFGHMEVPSCTCLIYQRSIFRDNERRPFTTYTGYRRFRVYVGRNW